MKRKRVKLITYKLIALAAIVIISGCDNEGPHQPLKAVQGDNSESANPQNTGATIDGPSYQEIQPLLQKNCAGCHDWHTNQAKFEATAVKGTLLQYIWDQNNVPSLMKTALDKTLSQEDREKIRNFARAYLSQQQNPSVQTAKNSTATSSSNNTAATKSSQLAIEMLSDVEKYNTVSSCTACHGAMGISHIEGVPHLAGLAKNYILTQLKAFSQVTVDDQGQLMTQAKAELGVEPRQDSNASLGHTMNRISNKLTDAQMELVAQYFSELEPPQGNKEDTLAKFASCVGCHTGQKEGFGPRLQGQNAKYLANQLRAFKAGTRKNAMMTPLAAQIDDSEIEDFAKYISNLKVQ